MEKYKNKSFPALSLIGNAGGNMPGEREERYKKYAEKNKLEREENEQ